MCEYSWKALYNSQLLESDERKLLYIPTAAPIAPTLSILSRQPAAAEETEEVTDLYSSNLLWSDLTVIYVDVFTSFGDALDDSVYTPGLNATADGSGLVRIGNRLLDSGLKTELLYLLYRLQLYGATISLHLHTKVTHIVTIQSPERKAVLKVIHVLLQCCSMLMYSLCSHLHRSTAAGCG